MSDSNDERRRFRRARAGLVLAAAVAVVGYLTFRNREVPRLSPETQKLAGRDVVVQRVPVASRTRGDGAVEVHVEVGSGEGGSFAFLPDTRLTSVGGVPPGGDRDPHRIQATTGDAGATLTLPAPGFWRIHASREGYQPASQMFEFAEGGALYEVRILLSPLSTIEGVVRTPRGETVEGAVVRVRPLRGEGAREQGSVGSVPGTVARHTTTDRGGRFRLYPITPGAFVELAVDSDRGLTTTSVAPLGAGEVRRVDLTLDARADIVGSIQSDARLGPARIECWRHMTSAFQLDLEKRATEAEDGRFRISNVRPGPKTLLAIHQFGNQVELGFKEVAAQEGQETDTGVFSLGGGAVTIVALVEGGGPVQRRLKVIARGVRAQPPYALYPFTLFIPSETEISIRGLTADRIVGEVIVCSGEDDDSADPAFEVGQIDEVLVSGSRIVVTVPRMRTDATGVVVATLKPPPGVPVEEMQGQVFVVLDGRLAFGSLGDNRGVEMFTLGRHVPGSYSLHAVANGWTASEGPFNLEGGEVRRVDVGGWVPGAEVSGECVDESGQALAGAEVLIEQYAEGPGGFSQVVLDTRTDAKGNFCFPSLPPLKGLHVRLSTTSGHTTPLAVDPAAGKRGIRLRGRP